MATTPDTVVGPLAREAYAECDAMRREIKHIATEVNKMRDRASSIVRIEFVATEVPANITLAYRHLEDASMRLGKAMQALDGGVSVYDKETTVGAFAPAVAGSRSTTSPNGS